MQIDLTDAGDPAHRAGVLAPLADYNAEQIGRRDEGGRFAVLLRDGDGAVEGGMYATHWMGWAKLEMAYLPAHRRGQGVGARMLASIEQAAIGRGCHGVWMQSLSMQAPGFYETQGYAVIGRLKDRPPGHEEVFLARQDLSGAGPATMAVEADPDPAHRDTLRRLLLDYTDTRAAPAELRDFALLVRDAAGAILGGMWGWSGRGWLYIDLFGLPPSLRRSGMGTRLMAMAEAEARARGCIGLYLDTFSFQARPFYEKQGLSVFGQIDNYPAGHIRYFLSKRWG
jgi:GNAT superfamily N-acetyltransferase